ncbi:DUF6882 domain-containing protein [Streptomyces sp. NPDC002690]
MGMFKRGNEAKNAGQPGDQALLRALLPQGEDMIEQLGRAHVTWGLGSADRWDLDRTTGTITWTFPDKTATAPAQLLGSFSSTSNSWLWAWANPSILRGMSCDARGFQDWAEANGHSGLAEPETEADVTAAATLAALAGPVTGYYRSQGSSSLVMTFGPDTLTAADGSVSSLHIDVD